MVARDAAEDEGREAGPLVRATAALPRRLGFHLPR
jgi:hypothetical protein